MGMRPLWERTVTWGIADHLFRQGVSEAHAYSAAALIVRALDRYYGLTSLVWNAPIENPADVNDPSKVPPLFLAHLRAFWGAVAGPATKKRERNRLLDLARSSMLRGGRPEVLAAGTLARDARSIEAVYGKLGASGWDAEMPELTGFNGFAGVEFGGLRDELGATGSADVLAAFDRLVSASAERKAVLKEFQGWMADLGWYTGRIDGIWGEKTETAYIHMFPWMLARKSELRDVKAIRDTIGFIDAKAIAVLITRDIWLDAHPENVVLDEPTTSVKVDSGHIDVTLPKESQSTTLPSGASQVVVSYPKASSTPGGGSAEPTRVEITLPPPAEVTASIVPLGAGIPKSVYIGGGLVLLGGAVLTTAYLWSRSRRAAEART